jgi:hypothetical protein
VLFWLYESGGTGHSFARVSSFMSNNSDHQFAHGQSGKTRQYYPRVRSILLGPVTLALLTGLPFLAKQGKMAAGLGIASAVFLLTLLAWRRVFRVKLSDGSISGRNPETAGWTQFELSSVTAVQEAEFSLGRIKGWALSNSRGDAVFVSERVLQDPAVRAVVGRIKHS